MGDIKGRTVLVTGASRGVGAATAVALAKAGATRVLIHYGTHREGAERTLSLVEGAGAEGELLSADLSTTDGIHRFLKDVNNSGLAIDVLVNNAGSLVQRAPLLQYTEELFDQVMNLNVKSVYLLSQAVAPRMLEKGQGWIINVSSIAARNGGGPGATIYAAAKAAVSAITKGMSKELAPGGIHVNAVSPGTVDNHFHEVFSTPETLENMRKTIPAGTLGTNEEVADTILFLCSEGSRYIHGQTIEINGGMYMV